MSKAKVKLAIIGCGGMANGHLRAYQRIKEKDPGKLELVAMCDPIRESAQKFADQTATFQDSAPRVYTDVDEMLKNEQLDGADICSPHAFHHMNAVACLEAGVNVIVEKPIGITVRASWKIIEAAKWSGKIAATAENIRRGLNQRTAHWIINEEKMLGDMRLFYAQHASWNAPDPSGKWHWRLDKNLGGGGMVMDSGAHFCDTIRYLFGDVDTVYAKVSQLEPRKATKDGKIVPIEVEDTWAATLTFESGLVGLWSVTWSAPAHSFTKVVYYGSKGTLVDSGDPFHGPFDGAEIRFLDGRIRSIIELRQEYLNTLDQDDRDRLFPHGFMDGVTLECYDFVDAIQNNRPPEVDGVTGLKAKSIGEAIFESGYCGEVVKFTDVYQGKVDAFQKPINEYWGI